MTFTTSHIENAYQWLIRQRKHYPDNADIWHLRFHWRRERELILSSVNKGEYRFSPLQIVKKASGESVALWSSADALVIKMLTDHLTPRLPVHRLCEHVKGNGGGQQSKRRVDRYLKDNATPFVFRTDIKGYYAAIDKSRLYNQLTRHISHPVLLNLLWQFLHHCVEDGGNFHTPPGKASAAELHSVRCWQPFICTTWTAILRKTPVCATRAIWMISSSWPRRAGPCVVRCVTSNILWKTMVLLSTRTKPS